MSANLNMKDRIRCSVSNCHYWMQGNYCEASSIMVTSDEVPRQSHHGIDQNMISQVDTPVGQCEQTCCKTFISNQERDEHRVDNVFKAGNQLNNRSHQTRM
jgi:hypothetical protein